jgi:hypothetical protein
MKRIIFLAVMVMMVAGCDCPEHKCPKPTCDVEFKNQQLIDALLYCPIETQKEIRRYIERGEKYVIEINDCSNEWTGPSRASFCTMWGFELPPCTVHYDGPITPAMKTHLHKEVTK